MDCDLAAAMLEFPSRAARARIVAPYFGSLPAIGRPSLSCHPTLLREVTINCSHACDPRWRASAVLWCRLCVTLAKDHDRVDLAAADPFEKNPAASKNVTTPRASAAASELFPPDTASRSRNGPSYWLPAAPETAHPSVRLHRPFPFSASPALSAHVQSCPSTPAAVPPERNRISRPSRP